MKTLKKLLCTALSLSLVLALAACGDSAPAATPPAARRPSSASASTAATAPWTTAGRASSRASRRPAWWRAPTITIDYQNANFDDATWPPRSPRRFSAKDAALMVGIATPSATACYAAAEDKDIPVVFTAITDPVGAKLDSGNITGTSDVLPVARGSWS